MNTQTTNKILLSDLERKKRSARRAVWLAMLACFSLFFLGAWSGGKAAPSMRAANVPLLREMPNVLETGTHRRHIPGTNTAAQSGAFVLTGTGDSIVDVAKWDGPAIAAIQYSGGGNFVVLNYGADDERIDLLVNTIGSYDGTVPLDFLVGEQTARFEVQSSGQWEITVLPLEQIRAVTIPGAFSGAGDDVILLQGASRPDLLTIDGSQAASNFVVIAFGNQRDLLVNEIAPYSGTVLIANDLPTDSGNLVLAISAEGVWSMDVSTK